MSSEFTLNGESINVNAFSGFDRPDDAQMVAVLSSSTSDHDTLVQQGNNPSPLASMSGRTSDYEQVALLRELRNSHEQVIFTEPDEGAHIVVVLTLEVHKVAPTLFLWEWSATIIEMSTGVGSGS